MRKKIEEGEVLICAETGKEFTASHEGGTSNYGRDNDGNVYSKEGVDIRERHDLLDRSGAAFYCYVSGDGRNVTGWPGNVLGRIEAPWQFSQCRATQFGYRFRVIDVHGQWWQARGAGPGMCCTLRPMKGPRTK